MPRVRSLERAASIASAAMLLLAPAAMGAEAVVSLTLVNADTDQDIGLLTNGMTLNLATLPTRNLNVRANTSPADVGSVKFSYNGISSYRIENGAPYTLAGDSGGTNYYAWTPEVNPSSSIVATPYSAVDASGTRGTPVTVSFSVIDQAQQVTGLSLLDSLTGQVLVANLAAGQTVPVADVMNKCLNIRALTNPSVVGSVAFDLTRPDGTFLSSMENGAPYDMMGDTGSRGCLALGNHTVVATPYELANEEGGIGTALSRTFTLAPDAVSDANLLFLGDFDGTDPLRDSRDSTKIYTQECALADSCVAVTSPNRGGPRAFRFTLRESDPMVHNGTRAEIGRNTGASAQAHTEQWYGFSTFIPADWQSDTQTGDIIAQWHSPNDDEYAAGEPGKSPPLSLYITGDALKVANSWDPKEVTLDNNPTLGEPKGWRGSLWQGSVSELKGRWVDWVFHVKWNYDGNGFVQVWKDGQQIVSKTGPNTYNDVGTITFKYGIYKSGWNNSNGSTNTVKKRVLYVDELRMGDRYSSYAEVAPR
jgi:Polysaccharide lyase